MQLNLGALGTGIQPHKLGFGPGAQPKTITAAIYNLQVITFANNPDTKADAESLVQIGTIDIARKDPQCEGKPRVWNLCPIRQSMLKSAK
ncbi:hypothetical protein MiSe_33980 [Microseira wollei NIES-4236]|uniref:Uncharacterized protein n=1 Tax=Microseira wollei NIES-4236 TaxID=2530354 RepID=A0AAV3XDX6_9CYAN|nr:hypothetical protein MiSe_33980 [Microseira wollei NIES-4236]